MGWREETKRIGTKLDIYTGQGFITGNATGSGVSTSVSILVTAGDILTVEGDVIYTPNVTGLGGLTLSTTGVSATFISGLASIQQAANVTSAVQIQQSLTSTLLVNAGGTLTLTNTLLQSGATGITNKIGFIFTKKQ